MKIYPLKERKEYLHTAAKWLYEEFARPGESLAFFTALLGNDTDPKNLPIIFIAEDDSKPVGTVALWRSDLLSRQDLTPWLALLYVEPESRGRHIGAMLQKEVLRYAKTLGYPAVYLYTDLINYYEKTGWKRCGEGIECDGTLKRIFIHET